MLGHERGVSLHTTGRVLFGQGNFFCCSATWNLHLDEQWQMKLDGFLPVQTMEKVKNLISRKTTRNDDDLLVPALLQGGL